MSLSIPLSGSLFLALRNVLSKNAILNDYFQFPCLGVYFWLRVPYLQNKCFPMFLSIPLSGSLFLALTRSSLTSAIISASLSIPLSGSLFLALRRRSISFVSSSSPFNSLVWESISGSDSSSVRQVLSLLLFQFPCLGVYFWLLRSLRQRVARKNRPFNSLVWESISGSR